MNLLQDFGRKAPNRVSVSIVLGALAGVAYAFLIPIVLGSLDVDFDGVESVSSKPYKFFFIEVANHQIAAVFLLLCVFILVARTVSRVMLVRISVELTVDLRSKLYARIMSANLAKLERVGPSRLLAMMTEDVRRIILGGQLLPDLLMNIVTLVGMLGFLAYLNAAAFVFVLQAIAFGVITYQIPVFVSNRYFRHSRKLFDRLQEAMRGLIYGAKELKQSAKAREFYLRQVLRSRESELLNSDKKVLTTMVAANSYGDLLTFFVIGVVAFVFVNYHAVTSKELVGIVMALLYVSGPVAVIMDVIPPIAMAKTALRNIQQVFGDLPEDSSLRDVGPPPPWQVIRFAGVKYSHERGSSSDGFDVGPLDFEVRRGEATFVVGGNGSGKSTLCKVLALHYLPAEGEILFDQHTVDDSNREAFRQDIGAIFSDYYLFDRLLTKVDAGLLSEANRYLAMLDLDGKVSIEDGVFSTLALSDGQRKRLALLVSLLDDRPLYIFDEWAADQDPPFKEIFYRSVLPHLKSKGKAVVVISHDDRYFEAADSLLAMEFGQIVRRHSKSGPGTD